MRIDKQGMATPELKTDDDVLVRRAIQGDRAALEMLLERHAPTALAFTGSFLSNRDDAMDAAQMALMRMAQELSGRWQGKPFKACLYVHAHDSAVNLLRQNASRRKREDAVKNSAGTLGKNADMCEDFIERVEREEHLEALREELAALPAETATVLALHHLDGLSVAEAAQAMDITLDACKYRLVRGREDLRQRLERRGVSIASVGMLGTLMDQNFSIGKMLASKVLPTEYACMTKSAIESANLNATAALNSSTTSHAPHAQTHLSAPSDTDNVPNTAAQKSFLRFATPLRREVSTMLKIVSLTALLMTMVVTTSTLLPSLKVPTVEQPSSGVTVAENNTPRARALEVVAAEVETKGDKDAPKPVAADQKPAPTAEKPVVALTADEIAAYSRQLADADAARRYEAYQKLRGAGEAARTALDAAAKSADANTSSVAKTLLGVLKTQPYLDKLAALAKTVKSIECDLEGSGKMMGMSMTMSGTFKAKPQEKKVHADATMAIGGTKMTITKKEVCDGITFWEVMTPPMGDATVMSFSPDYKILGAISMYDTAQSPLRTSGDELYDFVDVTEGTVDNKAVFILSGAVKPGLLEEHRRTAKNAQMEKMIEESLGASVQLYIGKDDSLVYKYDVSSKSNEQSMTFKNVKLNGEIDNQIFTYCPPAGVTIKDGAAVYNKLTAPDGETAVAANARKIDASATGEKPSTPPTQAEIAAAFRELSNPDAAKRYGAVNTLYRAGESAKSTLETAATSKQANVASTAKTLLAALKTQPSLSKLDDLAKSLKSIKAEVKNFANNSKMGLSFTTTATLIANPSANKIYQATDMTMSIGNMKLADKTVCDGTNLWMEQTNMMTTVSVYPANFKWPKGDKALLKTLDTPWNVRMCDDYIFTEVADGTDDGKPVTILTGTLKPGLLESKGPLTGRNEMGAADLSEIESVRLTLSKEDGLIRKLEVFNKDGEVQQELAFSQIKLGEVIDENIFDYTPPEGVKIKDGEAEAKKNQAEAEKENHAPVAPPETPGNF